MKICLVSCQHPRLSGGLSDPVGVHEWPRVRGGCQLPPPEQLCEPLLVFWEPLGSQVRVLHTHTSLGLRQPGGPLPGPSPKPLGLGEPIFSLRGYSRCLGVFFCYCLTLKGPLASPSERHWSPTFPALPAPPCHPGKQKGVPIGALAHPCEGDPLLPSLYPPGVWHPLSLRALSGVKHSAKSPTRLL